jgi:hypothetical protein
MAGLTVDPDSMVFELNADDSRDRFYTAHIVAEVSGDAEQNVKRVTEGYPYGMALPFALPQIEWPTLRALCGAGPGPRLLRSFVAPFSSQTTIMLSVWMR